MYKKWVFLFWKIFFSVFLKKVFLNLIYVFFFALDKDSDELKELSWHPNSVVVVKMVIKNLLCIGLISNSGPL